MSDMPVIYENPKYPLPEWARWLAKDSVTRAWSGCPVLTPSGWGRIGPHWGKALDYTILGHWQDSLRRIVRLSDPAYYAPENPHTDGEGFLPHDGGEMPEWVRGKWVQVVFRGGDASHTSGSSASLYRWAVSDRRVDDIIAYRIVGEQEEAPLSDRIRDKGIADPDVLHSMDKIKAEAKRILEEHRREESGPRTGGVLPSDGLLPRSPADASDEQYRRNTHLPSQEEVEERMYQQEQRYHRNELAARTLTPVPGMDSFMHDVIREARRFEYRKAALQGLSGNTHFSDLDAMEHAKKARLLGDAMFACEKPE